MSSAREITATVMPRQLVDVNVGRSSRDVHSAPYAVGKGEQGLQDLTVPDRNCSLRVTTSEPRREKPFGTIDRGDRPMAIARVVILTA